MKQASRLLIAENPLQVLPSLVNLVGLERAIILQQIHFLLGIPGGHDEGGHHWIHNTAQQWHDHYFIFWHPSSIQKWLKSLADDGFIVSFQFDKEKWDHKNYYRIDYDKLEKALSDSEELMHDSAPQAESVPLPERGLDSAPQAESLQRLQTETTTETTFSETDPPAQTSLQESEPSKTKRPAEKHNGRQHKCSPNYAGLFSAIARGTKMSPALDASQIGKAAREFDQIGATDVDVDGVVKWWYGHDWRGRDKHQPPTIRQLKEVWERAKGGGSGEVGTGGEPAGYKGLRDYLVTQMPEGAGYGKSG